MKTLFLLISLAVFSFANTEDQVLTELQAKDASLQKLIIAQKENDTPEIKEEMLKLVRDIFEFPTLAKMALPEETWKANDSLNVKYVDAFSRLLEDRFLMSVKGRIADSTNYDKPKAKEDEIKIKAYVWSKGKKTKLVYRLKEFEGKWKVYDLMTGPSSTLRSYQEQFEKLLKKKTYQELIELLEKKTAEPEEK